MMSTKIRIDNKFLVVSVSISFILINLWPETIGDDKGVVGGLKLQYFEWI